MSDRLLTQLLTEELLRMQIMLFSLSSIKFSRLRLCFEVDGLFSACVTAEEEEAGVKSLPAFSLSC